MVRHSSPWGERLDRSSPLPRYPRPGLVRPDWLSLNGPWDYAIRPSGACPLAGETAPDAWDGSIVVPFAVECALSGVGTALSPGETLWYRRRVAVPAAWAGRRVMLRFEAVDYQAAVFVNGPPAGERQRVGERQLVGEHRGGYLPFGFELPIPAWRPADEAAARPGDEALALEIVVAVRDPGDSGLQQRGKQSLHPAGILYSATSGIWQTVWLEPLPFDNSIIGVHIEPRGDLRAVAVTVACEEPAAVRLTVDLPGGGSLTADGRSGEAIDLAVPDARAWSPADPFLYPLRVELSTGGGTSGGAAANGAPADSAGTYFALRTVRLGPIPGAAAGAPPAVLLNGEPVFVNAVLDQGYWPESGMTAPDDDALVFDMESMKALGFNALRKHVKVESRRFYWHADRLGMLVIQDAVSGGINRAAGTLKVAAAMILGLHAEDRSARAMRLAGRSDPSDRDEFERDLAGMVDLLRGHPSIIMWTAFNESWGQFESARIAAGLRRLDPSRLVDAVSGWHDQGGGDFRSRHSYIVPLRRPPRGDRRPYCISEYGGYNLAVPGHLWDGTKRFGYKFYDDAAGFRRGYASLIRGQLIPLLRHGLRAAVYTQVSDVEIENNGLYTYDRRVLKIDAGTVRSLNGDLYAAFARLGEGGNPVQEGSQAGGDEAPGKDPFIPVRSDDEAAGPGACRFGAGRADDGA